jgi:hypothetical protein
MQGNYGQKAAFILVNKHFEAAANAAGTAQIMFQHAAKQQTI